MPDSTGPAGSIPDPRVPPAARPEQRADVALAARGLARSRTEAAALVRAGEVFLDGRPLRRPAQPVPAEGRLTLATRGPRYVSRAAHKLVSALDAFGVDPTGRRALDAGASTGGFTQVLLERGAAEVAAVDVGHGQLAEPVRWDPRVRVHEGLNVRDLTREHTGGAVDLVVSDLSFISLRLVLAPLAGACAPGAPLLLMVKPQFEVGRAALPRTGVVTDPAARRAAVAGVIAEALRLGLEVAGIARSGLPGQDGNVEYFLHLRAPAGASAGAPAGTPASDGGLRPDTRAADASAQDAGTPEADAPAVEAARLVAAAEVDWD